MAKKRPSAADDKEAKERAWEERADERWREMVFVREQEWPWPYTLEQFQGLVDLLDRDDQAAHKVLKAAHWYLGGIETLDKSTRTPHRDAQDQLIDLHLKCQNAYFAVESLSMQAKRALGRGGLRFLDIMNFMQKVADGAIAAAGDQGRTASPAPKGGPHPYLASRRLLASLGEIYCRATGLADSLPRAGDKKSDDSDEGQYDDDVDAFDAALAGHSGPFLDFLRLATVSLPGFERLGDRGLVERYRTAKRHA